MLFSATFHYWGSGADDPDLFVTLTRSTATLSRPNLLYIIRGNGPLRVFVIPVFLHGFVMLYTIITLKNIVACFNKCTALVKLYQINTRPTSR